jgi:steroid delta-isomerase-like uncharacterized protein
VELTPPEQLRETIADYNDAWNAHDVDRIASMHAPEMVFENHTAGERAEGDEALGHIARIFESWPDITFETRRIYVRENLVVQEWTATATHVKPLQRGDLVAEPSGKRIRWEGMDVIPFEHGMVKRKDVYSDSVSILSQVGLLQRRRPRVPTSTREELGRTRPIRGSIRPLARGCSDDSPVASDIDYVFASVERSRGPLTDPRLLSRAELVVR